MRVPRVREGFLRWSAGFAVSENHSESTVRQIGVVFNVVIRIRVRRYLFLPRALALNLSRGICPGQILRDPAAGRHIAIVYRRCPSDVKLSAYGGVSLRAR